MPEPTANAGPGSGLTEADLARIERELEAGWLDEDWPAQTIDALIDSHRRLRTQVAKLQAFKDWVHGYLDAQGVPHHPPGTHGAEGCRIGDRMDWVFEMLGRRAGK
jgi:hypothetical protein